MSSLDRKQAMLPALATVMLNLLLILVCLGSAHSYANVIPQGRLVSSFTYNAEGLRIEKQGERGTERYTYDDQSVLSQRDANNGVITRYTYGPNRLIALEHNTEGTQFYLTDALNSVANLVTKDGLVQARYQYDAFGTKRSESGSSWNRFAFTGYEEDKETSLLYAKARYYDADTARFLSQDAWQGDNNIPPSLNKYLYSYQNPTVWVDPDGNAPVFKETADGLHDWADKTKAAADKLEDNGLNVFAAAGMGLGAGLLDTMGAAADVVNQGVNVATDIAAGKNSSSLWAQESRADLTQTRGEITNKIESGVKTAEIIKENPSAAMNAVKDAAVTGAKKFASGDTGALSETFSALAVVPPVMAGVKATANSVKFVGEGALAGAKKISEGYKSYKVARRPGGEWSNLPGGVRIKKTGNYWIKEVNPHAASLAQWFGRGSLNAQSRGLDKLGNLAPSHLFRNGKLITRDAGTYTPGNFWSTWAEGSRRLGTPFNDIRPRNIGSGGLIFDPAKHPIQQGLEAGAVGLGAGLGGLYLYDEFGEDP